MYNNISDIFPTAVLYKGLSEGKVIYLGPWCLDYSWLLIYHINMLLSDDITGYTCGSNIVINVIKLNCGSRGDC